jgi:hypothetical protein
VHINWTDVAEEIGGVNRVMFITCETIGMVLCYFQTFQGESGSLNALKKCAYWLLRRYKLKIFVIRSNNELIKGNAITHWLKIMGVSHEPSAAYTQNQNGRAERTRGVVFSKDRSMRIHARLPHKLWRKAVNASVYLHNRTPRAQNHWATPYTLFHTYIAERDGIKDHITPETAHLKAYSCVAYAASISYIKTPRANRLHKLDFRFDVGYLVGYNSTNIYRVWIPYTRRIISTRNVIFDESKFFNGRKEHLTELELAQLNDLMQRIQLPDQVARNKAIAEDESDDVFEPLPDLNASEATAEDPSLKVNEELAKALDQELLEAYETPDLENDERIEDCIEVATSYSFLHLPVRLKGRPAEGFSAGGVAEGLYYQGVSNAENAVKAESPASTAGGTAKANLARCW